MNCSRAELYMNALMDNELPVTDSLEVIEHLESCQECKKKWELSEETRSKLKHFAGSIKASNKLKSKIFNSLSEKKKIIYLKPTLIAASVVFLLGVGMLFGSKTLAAPSLFQLHHHTDIQLRSKDAGRLAKHIKVTLHRGELRTFKKAHYKLRGASRVQKPFYRNISLVSFINKKGNTISLCYLPGSYNVDNCHEVKIHDTIFYCGQRGCCNYTYWKHGGETVALVSDEFTPEEMIDFAIPMV